ncbi:GcrA family cell cycle regulator [Phyllobacterium sp. 22229]|uniref:GcrA family cell cycle regulator n=1 Tax=Phyllobacterium sp. 22229 TaxID=3453895 RepID=UPI003F87A17C
MNMYNPFQWTDEVVARMKTMVIDGQSGSVIARELGTTRSAVLGKMFRLNMKTAPKTSASLVGKINKRTFNSTNLAAKKATRALDPLFEAPKPAITTKEYEADCLRLLIHECGVMQCRFEIDSPAQGGEYRFCGKETDEGQSWCPHHRKLVFQPRSETLRAKAKAEHIARRVA